MASFIAKIFGGGGGSSTPTPAPRPAPATKKPAAVEATRARTRSKYAGAIKEKRAAEDAKVAKKKLLGD